MKIIALIVLGLMAQESAEHLQSPDDLDSWFSIPPVGKAVVFFKAERNAADIVEVIEALQADAQAALESVPFAPLTKSEAERYTLRELDSNQQYFLIRAVACNPGGKFRAYPAGTELGIFHGSLGGSFAPRRRAVVVAL
jgi:hypothetical protein